MKRKYIGLISVVFFFVIPLEERKWTLKQFEAFNRKSAATTLEITYIANEGVLISSDGKYVLIDGLYRQGVSGYGRIPAEILERIETAQNPFDNINLILVSHPHADHYDPYSIGRYLQNNSHAQLISSEQVIEGLSRKFNHFQSIEKQTRGITPNWGDRIEIDVDGIGLEIFRLRHGYRSNYKIHNLGQIIKMGGIKLLHIGDAETAVENFEKFKLNEADIDIAFIPFWYLTDRVGQVIVRTHIKPKKIIAVHIPPKDAKKITSDIKKVFPGADTFIHPMEKRSF